MNHGDGHSSPLLSRSKRESIAIGLLKAKSLLYGNLCERNAVQFGLDYYTANQTAVGAGLLSSIDFVTQIKNCKAACCWMRIIMTASSMRCLRCRLRIRSFSKQNIAIMKRQRKQLRVRALNDLFAAPAHRASIYNKENCEKRVLRDSSSKSKPASSGVHLVVCCLIASRS